MSNGRFQLGPSAVRGAVSTIGPLIQDVSPHLRELARRTGQTAHLAVLVGTRCMTVARTCERDRGIHVDEVNETFPFWATALGKALVATQAPKVRRDLLPPEPYLRFTAMTARTARDLFGRVARDEETGIFQDRGSFTPDFAAWPSRSPGEGRSRSLRSPSAIRWRRPRTR